MLPPQQAIGIDSDEPSVQASCRVPDLEGSIVFRIHVWPDDYEAQYNEYKLPIPVHERFRSSAHPGFGSTYVLRNRGSVRISNIQIRRIPPRLDLSTASLEEQATFYETLVQIDEDDVAAKIELAAVRCRQKRWQDAERLLSYARKDGLCIAQAWEESLALLTGLRRYEEAISMAEKITAKVPGHTLMHHHVAWLRSTAPDDELRDGEASLERARRITAIEPRNWRYQMALSAALAENGDAEEAARAWETAVSLAGGNEEAVATINETAALRTDDGRIRLLPPDSDAQD